MTWIVMPTEGDGEQPRTNDGCAWSLTFFIIGTVYTCFKDDWLCNDLKVGYSD
jgi:hypothetical protein